MGKDEQKPASKKAWVPPTLTVYGTVVKLTRQPKLKVPGGMDDFAVPGISDFP